MSQATKDILSARAKFGTSDAKLQVLPMPTEKPLKFELPTPPEVGRGGAEMLRLNAGMFIVRAMYQFRPPYHESFHQALERVEETATEPMLQIQSARHGEARVSDLLTGEEYGLRNTTSRVGSFEAVEESVLMGRNGYAETNKLVLPVSQLSELMGEKVAHSLISTLGLTSGDPFRTIEIPPSISDTLHQAFSSIYLNGTGRLFAEGKVLQYLAQLAGHVTGDEMRRSAPPKERKIRQLREQLDHLNAPFPPLVELAQQYGVSARTLNDGFKALYGQSIHTYLVDRQLDLAHEALRETDIAMKVLAAQAGYGHVTNFIAAFKRKFGYPPGELRRLGRPSPKPFRLAAD